jgi:hypothetical protein
VSDLRASRVSRRGLCKSRKAALEQRRLLRSGGPATLTAASRRRKRRRSSRCLRLPERRHLCDANEGEDARSLSEGVIHVGYGEDPLRSILAKPRLEEISEEEREMVHERYEAERTRILRADLEDQARRIVVPMLERHRHELAEQAEAAPPLDADTLRSLPRPAIGASPDTLLSGPVPVGGWGPVTFAWTGGSVPFESETIPPTIWTSRWSQSHLEPIFSPQEAAISLAVGAGCYGLCPTPNFAGDYYDYAYVNDESGFSGKARASMAI